MIEETREKLTIWKDTPSRETMKVLAEALGLKAHDLFRGDCTYVLNWDPGRDPRESQFIQDIRQEQENWGILTCQKVWQIAAVYNISLSKLLLKDNED